MRLMCSPAASKISGTGLKAGVIDLSSATRSKDQKKGVRAWSVIMRSGSTAAWILQQHCGALGYEDRYRYLIHDRDSIFAKCRDDSIDSASKS